MTTRWSRVAFLLACMSGVAQTHPAAPRNSGDVVSGRILSAAGTAIANAVVSLLPQSMVGEDAEIAESEGATVRTDAEGRYRFEPQTSGRYTLQASAKGYLSSLYQQHDQYSTAVVLGAGLRTDALDVRLIKIGSILGRVTDGYGDPVERASLTLYRKSAAAGANTQDETSEGIQATPFLHAMTDGTGAYSFNPLPPGTYYLEVTATPWYAVHPPLEAENDGGQYRTAVDPALDVAYAPVFYPHALHSDEASALELKGGERTVANLQMQAEHALSLTIVLPPAPPGEPFRSLQLFKTVFGARQDVDQQSYVSDGRMQITGLVAGQYTVDEFVPGIGPVPRCSLDLTDGTAPFSFAAIEAAGMASASVHIQAAGGGSLPDDVQVRLRGRATENLPATKVDDHGMAQLATVAAGNYRLDVLSGNRRLGIVDMSADGKPTSNHQLHVVAGNGKLSVELSVSLSTTRLTGTVRRGGQPEGGAMIVLVPAGVAPTDDLFRRDQSDLDGGFTLRGVVPGKYLLLAIEDGWTLPWTDATAMAGYFAHAIPIVIAEGVRDVTPVLEAVPAQPR